MTRTANAPTPTETTNLDGYGSAPLEWSRVLTAVVDPSPAFTWFLGTVRPDGTPHTAGVGAHLMDGAFYFPSSLAARKARNLAANPACTLSAHLEGLDLVVDGVAERVSDPDELEKLAAEYRRIGWPARVEDDAVTAPFSAPSAGPPPWHVFRVTVRTAVAVASAEPHGATRWRFAA